MDDALSHRIQRDILDAYGSLESPRFSFVEKRYRKNPYAALIGEIGGTYHVSETTDLNDDVAISLVLTGNGRRWTLALSLVGRYAWLARIRDTGPVEILSSASGNLQVEERTLLHVLVESGITILSEEVLRHKIRFPAADTDAEACLLYEVLFSSVGIPFRS